MAEFWVKLKIFPKLRMAIHLIDKIAIGEWPVQTQFRTDPCPIWAQNSMASSTLCMSLSANAFKSNCNLRHAEPCRLDSSDGLEPYALKSIKMC